VCTQVPIDCFEEQWVIFRGKDKRPGCVQNTCAHRACPLDLGSVNEGRITCPYHGKNSENYFIQSGFLYSLLVVVRQVKDDVQVILHFLYTNLRLGVFD
jgi:hypothetical protein